MALTPGTRLGPYEIAAQIGVGGMARCGAPPTPTWVVRSRSKSPDAFAHDPERLARFEREAKTLASLNHPNTRIIHGLVTALVSERQFRWETVDESNSGDPIELFSSLRSSEKPASTALAFAHCAGVSVRDGGLAVGLAATVRTSALGLTRGLVRDAGG